ncbi:hypothetical protein VP01_2725g3 [Puccinia sorghi]|uniref:MPN domain-containing protein n=1 Tax=Puccinia sorghi TaxID=27349 RepID=A0A0L6V407_9BASI|nr:hypothetical protein VP01_2725g3 [Puccinia sorghi]
MKKCVVSRLPTVKILRHQAKYPHSTVIGFLVGTVEGDSVQISDAIPFVHHWLDLSPMLEAGLALAKIHVHSKNLMLLGTYVAHSRTDLKYLDIVSQRLNDSLQSDSTVALVVDNEKLTTAENPFIPYTRTTTSAWTRMEGSNFQADIPTGWGGCEDFIGDFDDHLEDLGVDWLVNPTVICPA